MFVDIAIAIPSEDVYYEECGILEIRKWEV